MRKPPRHTIDDSALGAALSHLWSNVSRDATPRLSTANHMTAAARRQETCSTKVGGPQTQGGGPQTTRPADTYTEQYVLDTFSDWLADNCDKFGFSASDHDSVVLDFQAALQPKSRLTQPITAGGYLKGEEVATDSAHTYGEKGKVKVESFRKDMRLQNIPAPGFLDYKPPYTRITTQRLRDMEADLFCDPSCFRGRRTPTTYAGQMQREVMLHLDANNILSAFEHSRRIEAVLSGDTPLMRKLRISPWRNSYATLANDRVLFWNNYTSCFHPDDATCRANGIPSFLLHVPMEMNGQ